MTNARPAQTETPQEALQANTRIGKYQVDEFLDRNELYLRYKGYDTVLNRPVILKQIVGRKQDGPGFTERLQRNVSQIRQLGDSPRSIVGVLDVAKTKDGLFVVQEYIRGYTLQQVLDRQEYAIPVQFAVEILWSILNGLKLARDAGVVHGDLRPSDILVTRDYKAKVDDLVLGAATREGQADRTAPRSVRHAAPERLEGAEADVRSDLYSLGFITYEMLTGRAFFARLFGEVLLAGEKQDLLWAKWHADKARTLPNLSQINERVPASLGAIIERMMSKEPEKRYASPDEVMADLREAIGVSRPEGRIAATAVAVEQVASGQAGPIPDVAGQGLWLPDLEPPAAKEAAGPRRPWLFAVFGVTAAGLAIAFGAALAIIIGGHESLRAEQAGTAHQTAVATYRQGVRDYQAGNVQSAGETFSEAHRQFDAFAESYGDFPRMAADAQGWSLLSEARLAMLEARWDDATDQLDRAENMNVFDPEVIADLRGELTSRLVAAGHLNMAASALETGDEQAAEAALAAATTMPNLPTDLQAEIQKMTERLATRRIRAQHDTLAGQGSRRLEQALLLLREGRAGEQTQALLAEAADLFHQADAILVNPAVKEQLARADRLAEYAEGVVSFQQARDAGDLQAQAIALEAMAASLVDDSVLAGQLVSAQASLAYEEAMELLATGLPQNWPAARDKLVQAQAYESSPEIEQALAELERRIERRDLLDSARLSAEAGDNEQAIALYRQAQAMGDDEGQIARQIEEVAIESHLDAARSARQAGQWDRAVELYEQAAAVRPDDVALADRMTEAIGQVRLERQYEAFVEQANLLAKQGAFDEAVDALTEAEPVAEQLGEPTITQLAALKRKIRYDWELSRGKEAMGEDDLPRALGHFSIAHRLLDTPEVRELIEQVRKDIRAPEDRQTGE